MERNDEIVTQCVMGEEISVRARELDSKFIRAHIQATYIQASGDELQSKRLAQERRAKR